MPVKLTVCGPALSLNMRLAIGSNVGGSFTAFTVRRKLMIELAPLGSVAVRVMVAAPNWLVSGKMLKVRLVPLPDTIIRSFEIRLGLEELPVKVRLETA